MHVCAFSQNHKIFKNKAIILTVLHKFIKHIPESIWIYISAMKKMHEIFQFCCNKSQFHFENCHSPFNDFSRNYGCHIGFKLWVTSIFLCFDVQVNLCQKLFFLHIMGRTCCVQKLFWMSETISAHNMFSPGLSLECLCIEVVIQWKICRHVAV